MVRPSCEIALWGDEGGDMKASPRRALARYDHPLRRWEGKLNTYLSSPGPKGRRNDDRGPWADGPSCKIVLWRKGGRDTKTSPRRVHDRSPPMGRQVAPLVIGLRPKRPVGVVIGGRGRTGRAAKSPIGRGPPPSPLIVPRGHPRARLLFLKL